MILIHKSRRLLYIAMTGMALVLIVGLQQNMNTQQYRSSPRALWNAIAIHNYRMRVDIVSLPAPQIGLELTVQDERVVQQSIIACDHPSEQYPAKECETIKRYYAQPDKYTVSQLLDIADDCIQRTKIAFARCPAITTTSGGFAGFSNPDDMVKMGEKCQTYLRGEDMLCYVKYDPVYGYPKMISRYIPAVMDGFSTISVKQFRAN